MKKLTVAQAAAKMGVNVRTVQDWIKRGWLPSERVPPGLHPRRQIHLIDPTDLRALKDRPKRGPKKAG